MKPSLVLQGLAEDLPDRVCGSHRASVHESTAQKLPSGRTHITKGNGASLCLKALPEGGEVMPAGGIAFDKGRLKNTYFESVIFDIL